MQLWERSITAATESTKDLKIKRWPYFLESAKKENITAENNLGFMYEHGLGVNRDFGRSSTLV